MSGTPLRIKTPKRHKYIDFGDDSPPASRIVSPRAAVRRPDRPRLPLSDRSRSGKVSQGIANEKPRRAVASLSGGAVVLEGAAKKEDAERVLQKRPLLVLFFMNGCPHCEANKPAWDQAKKKIKGGATVAEIESEATPDSAGVSGFPTMKYVDATGKETVTSGQKSSGDELLKDLQAPTGSVGGRRTRRRRAHHRTRKLRHRSLRSDVAFV